MTICLFLIGLVKIFDFIYVIKIEARTIASVYLLYTVFHFYNSYKHSSKKMCV